MLTILLTLVMWGSSANAARPDDTTSSERPGLPAGVKAGDYVKAVAKLYQNGQPDKAALYLKAANDFRDQLSAEDRATLDSFNAKLNATAAAAKAPRDPATMAASVKPLTTGAESSPRDRAVMLVAAAMIRKPNRSVSRVPPQAQISACSRKAHPRLFQRLGH